MKIRVYAETFKNAVQRITPVIPKRSVFAHLQSVRIIAESNDTITLYACDMTNSVSITIPGIVHEIGYADVMFDDLKKIVNIKDDVVITDSIESGTIEFRTSKKTYTVISSHYDDVPMIEFGKVASETEIPESILANLKPLATMKSDNEYDGVMTGIFFDLEHSRIATLDSHRIGILNIDVPVAESFIAQGETVPILKSLIGKRNDGNVKVSFCKDKNIVMFSGEDFTFSQKAIEGKYYDIDKIYKNCKNYHDAVFTVDHKEITEISKEYKKVIPADDRKPMVLAESNGVICTGICLPTYKTSDVLETAKIKNCYDGFYIGVNPAYIVDAASFIGKELEIRMTTQKAPMYISDEDHVKECIVLPVNCTGDASGYVEFIRKQAG